MREIDKLESHSHSHSEERLADALRHLAQASPRSAPPDVGAALGGAFRRHHRRRRAKNAAIAALAIVCLSSAAWLFTRTLQKPEPQVVRRAPAPAVTPLVTTAANATGTQEIKKIVKRAPRHGASPRQGIQTEARQEGNFLALPAYDPAITKGELQIIRIEMPIQDLRLVGAPVGAAIPNRPVLADFVVGRDGTPYAVRLVQ